MRIPTPPHNLKPIECHNSVPHSTLTHTIQPQVSITNADGSTNSSPVMGAIGIAMNGVAIYGDADAENRDAYQYEGVSFDSCNGHAGVCGVHSEVYVATYRTYAVHKSHTTHVQVKHSW